MREWKKGRGDCISPNGQNSQYGQRSDRPGKRKRPVSSRHTDHYFRRALFYALLILCTVFQSSHDNPGQLRVAARKAGENAKYDQARKICQ